MTVCIDPEVSTSSITFGRTLRTSGPWACARLAEAAIPSTALAMVKPAVRLSREGNRRIFREVIGYSVFETLAGSLEVKAAESLEARTFSRQGA